MIAEYATGSDNVKEYGADLLWYNPSLSIGPATSYLDNFHFSDDIDHYHYHEGTQAPTGSLSGTVTAGSKAAAQWLIGVCDGFTATAAGSVFTSDHLADEILRVYKGACSKHSHDSANIAEEMQARVFELVGEQGFEFLLQIMEDISNFEVIESLEDVRSTPSQTTFDERQQPSMHNSTSKLSFNEIRKQERKAMKLEREAAASAAAVGAQADDFENFDYLQSVGFDSEYLEQERALGLHGGDTHASTGPSVREILSEYGSLEFHEKKGLPAGSEKKVRPGYEEVHMPAPAKPQVSTDDLVDITDLEEWAQLAFPNTKRLNRIQSAVYSTAYHSSENMLVCAPTGAGKTNIAMLAFLQLVKQNISGGELDVANIKAIYVAPMKALAQEVVSKFSERLEPLGMTVKECTGDIQLTKQEIADSQLIVTTPEKYDVITRKGGDGSLGTLVSLIIIDEVHLLADERGAVIETIVARTLRYVESSQRPVRLVGLSATLPNYKDVAQFLGVHPRTGLFHFGPEYRPVPLEQTFVGITEKNRQKQKDLINRIAYEKMFKALERGKQVMIFVHSRKETSKTCEAMRDLSSKNGTSSLLEGNQQEHEKYTLWKREVDKSRNREVQMFFGHGLGIHHAGMLRADRTLTEQLFEQGLIRVLCCTATLAWGVNLPAHTVIIHGTELYDPERGGFVDISMLDVLQIFGRAGRPQYDSTGHAILISSQQSMNNYLSLLASQIPIESGLIKALADHMNAEIVNGTINNIREASQWLSYTFLYIRMLKNPMAYGMTMDERIEDNQLELKRMQLIRTAAEKLDSCRMIRYDPRSGNLAVTDLGRIASHYYIKHGTIDSFNTMLLPHLAEAEALHVLCSSAEFDQLKIRPEEMTEIDTLKKTASGSVGSKLSSDDTPGKVHILLQNYLLHTRINSFTLQSDVQYVAQHASRITRALFEICLKRGWSTLTFFYLTLCKCIDRQMQNEQTPLRQFASYGDDLPQDILLKIEALHCSSVFELQDLSSSDVGALIRNHKFGAKVQSMVCCLPMLHIDATVQPITRSILRISIELSCDFTWSDRVHGKLGPEPFWIWIEDGENEVIYHSESFNLFKKQRFDKHLVVCTIPVREPLPPQYYIRVVSDRWVGCHRAFPISFKHLILPDRMIPHTELLDIHPVPPSALKHPLFEGLYRGKFSHFNPIQSQVFHVLYHTDRNVLVGAPTGSGKTILAELALLRLLNQAEQIGKRSKAIYVAPLKALARERLVDWQKKLGGQLGLTVLELTGDVTPDLAALKKADLLIVTPEKWDSISRGWKTREYVQQVGLIVIDEIHLLGVDRGPVLEVIVSRMRFISTQTKQPIRFVGLSTALANPRDLADWLGIESEVGVYNFRPSVRPVPMSIHIQGFPGKHYCPRMATMNKPCYAAILEHSPTKPALIFVSSRRQTRLTALDLISYCVSADNDSLMGDHNPKQFLHMPEEEINDIAQTLRDKALRDTIVFGVGIHHAGLDNHDRAVVEELFEAAKIQVLVCTSTLAWGVNLPCHLVIVKGTEYYDGKMKRYVDMPVTDVLQMIGRAGRPQFDDSGVACVFVHEPMKNFYRKFLHEPFPVESSLHKFLHNHLNAEVYTESLRSKRDCVEYLSWTYFFRRLIYNPSYYGLEDPTPEGLQEYLGGLIDGVLDDLRAAGCINITEDHQLTFTSLGKIASYYYLDYRTVKLFAERIVEFVRETSQEQIKSNDSVRALCQLMCEALEFSELPVRHNEELLNAKLAELVPWPVDVATLEKPHTKAFLLLQAHFFHAALPIADYVNDTKSVLDQAPRVLNAFIDIAAEGGHLDIVLSLTTLLQMIYQGLNHDPSSSLLQLPGVSLELSVKLRDHNIRSIRDLCRLGTPKLNKLASDCFPSSAGSGKSEFVASVRKWPQLECRVQCQEWPATTSAQPLSGDVRLSGLTAGIEYDLIVDIQDHSDGGGASGGRVYCPRYHKPKAASWWLMLSLGNELLALKRIGSIGSAASFLRFSVTEELKRKKGPLEVILIPDCMLHSSCKLSLST